MKNGRGHGFFIAGTDTDIGKTFISRLLADTFSQWTTVTYMKPVQTGCTRDLFDNLVAPDFEYLMEGRAMQTAGPDDHVPYRFEPACSPHLAASREGVMISLEHIRDRYAHLSNKKSVTIVEGAGGVLTPLSETTSMIDLMLHLALPVVLVTSPRVGTLNHTFLTLNALRGQGIEPAGIVVNNRLQVLENYVYLDTIRMILDHAPGSALLEVGFEAMTSDSVKEFCHGLEQRL